METQEERTARLKHVSYQQQLRLPMERDESRESRLQQMSSLQHFRLSMETDKKRADRLSSEEGKLKFFEVDISPCSNSVMFKPKCILYVRKRPLLNILPVSLS